MSETSTRWSANVISDGAARLWYFIDGRPVTQSLPGTLDIVCPEEHLLLAAAGCYALNCQAVLARSQCGRPAFEVIATADRSADPAGALSQVALTCIFSGDLSAEDAERVTAEAQPRCTVSNTLTAAAGVSYQVRVLQQALRGFGPVCAAAQATEPSSMPARASWPAH